MVISFPPNGIESLIHDHDRVHSVTSRARRRPPDVSLRAMAVDVAHTEPANGTTETPTATPLIPITDAEGHSLDANAARTQEGTGSPRAMSPVASAARFMVTSGIDAHHTIVAVDEQRRRLAVTTIGSSIKGSSGRPVTSATNGSGPRTGAGVRIRCCWGIAGASRFDTG